MGQDFLAMLRGDSTGSYTDICIASYSKNSEFLL